MTDKEKYINLMQRYWDAETTPQEELDLARFIAKVADPEFEELRGVLGYLSIGKEKGVRKAKTVHLFPLVAVAASIIAVAAIGFGLKSSKAKAGKELYVCYSYGDKTTDNQKVMANVESSLADFFGGSSPVESCLFEMFLR